MGASNEKYIVDEVEATGLRGYIERMLKSGPVIIQDETTVMGRIKRDLTIRTVIAEEFGYHSLLTFLKQHEKEKMLELWKHSFTFRKKKERMTTAELQEYMEEVILPYFTNVHIKKCLPAEMIKDVSIAVRSKQLDDAILDLVYKTLNERLEFFEYGEWENTEEPELFIKNIMRLQDYVDDHHFMSYFEMFLAKEYSSENIDFIDAVASYKMKFQAAKPTLNVKLAAYMMRMFITEDSPLQINIPSVQRVELEKTILTEQRAPIDVFDTAKEEAILLMARDSWPRFRRSKPFKKFLQSLRPLTQNFEPLAPKDAYTLRKKIFHENIGSDKLEAILTSMVGCDALDRFLRVDNPKDGTVNFIQDVSFFKKLGSIADERTKAAAFKIYEAYFTDDAPKELPISDIMRDRIAVEMQGPDYYTVLFDPCVGELRHRLISQRIFKKFKECTLYVKYRMMIKSRHCDQVSSGSSMRESSLRDHSSSMPSSAVQSNREN